MAHRTLREQLTFSHEAYALYKKHQLLHRTGHVTEQQLLDSKAFAKETKEDLLSMLAELGVLPSAR